MSVGKRTPTGPCEQEGRRPTVSHLPHPRGLQLGREAIREVSLETTTGKASLCRSRSLNLFCAHILLTLSTCIYMHAFPCVAVPNNTSVALTVKDYLGERVARACLGLMATFQKNLHTENLLFCGFLCTGNFINKRCRAILSIPCRFTLFQTCTLLQTAAPRLRFSTISF